MDSHDQIADAIRAAHSRIAREYGLVALDGQLPVPSYRHWVMDRYGWRHMSWVFHHALGGECQTLVDAGCGNGQFSHFYLTQGAQRVIGLDFSEEMLDAATERIALAGFSGRFTPIQVDLRDLSAVGREIADMVQLYGVTEHLDDPWLVVANLAQLLRPGGVLLFAVPRRWSLPFYAHVLIGNSPSRWGQARTWRDRFRVSERLRYYRFYSRGETERMIAAANDCELVARIPFACAILYGRLAVWGEKQALNGEQGYARLDKLDRLLSRWPVPGAEYIVLRRRGCRA